MNIEARLLHYAILRSKPPHHMISILEEHGIGHWNVHTEPGHWTWDIDRISKMSWVEAQTLYDEMKEYWR